MGFELDIIGIVHVYTFQGNVKDIQLFYLQTYKTNINYTLEKICISFTQVLLIDFMKWLVNLNYSFRYFLLSVLVYLQKKKNNEI